MISFSNQTAVVKIQNTEFKFTPPFIIPNLSIFITTKKACLNQWILYLNDTPPNDPNHVILAFQSWPFMHHQWCFVECLTIEMKIKLKIDSYASEYVYYYLPTYLPTVYISISFDFLWYCSYMIKHTKHMKVNVNCELPVNRNANCSRNDGCYSFSCKNIQCHNVCVVWKKKQHNTQYTMCTTHLWRSTKCATTNDSGIGSIIAFEKSIFKEWI